MIDFGRQCTANTNWAGSVRLVVADEHYEASQEIQDNDQRAAYWRKPSVWADIRSAYEQFFTLYPNEKGYRQDYAYYAYRCERYQDFLNQVKLFPYTN
jgi:hypothetical protein